MFNFLTNVAKVALNVAVAPVAVVADIVRLPATAFDNKHPFGATKKVIENIGKNAKDALE